MIDPAFPGCDWKLPAGSADPFSIQFKAVASLGDGCPTLDLPYAAPLNMVTNARGLPIDARRPRDRRGVEPARAAAVQGPERQRRSVRRFVPARHAPAADAPRRARPRRSIATRSRSPRDRRADRGQRRRLLPVGRGDRRQQVPGQHGRRQRQLRPRAVRAGRAAATAASRTPSRPSSRARRRSRWSCATG